ncbi:MAG: hypothetical protein HC770_08135 [Pseudanabaena sp. CRU_2_10]|nr:hypothetical protein [Pseudanabaena sp. CRU_2_10]
MVKPSLGFSTVIALALVLTSAIAAFSQRREALQHGTLWRTLRFDGIERTYRIHVPLKYDGKKQVPVAIVLHGFGGNSKNALEQGKWIEKSEKEGFLAVGLDGTLKSYTVRKFSEQSAFVE